MHGRIVTPTFGKLEWLIFSWLSSTHSTEETMKPTMLITAPPLNLPPILNGTSPAVPKALPQVPPSGTLPKEPIRHIFLGSSGAVRQTIHLLHALHYAETVLWSPVLPVEEQLIITPAQGETMSFCADICRLYLVGSRSPSLKTFMKGCKVGERNEGRGL